MRLPDLQGVRLAMLSALAESHWIQQCEVRLLSPSASIRDWGSAYRDGENFVRGDLGILAEGHPDLDII
jgi:hypothetical protein